MTERPASSLHCAPHSLLLHSLTATQHFTHLIQNACLSQLKIKAHLLFVTAFFHIFHILVCYLMTATYFQLDGIICCEVLAVLDAFSYIIHKAINALTSSFQQTCLTRRAGVTAFGSKTIMLSHTETWGIRKHRGTKSDHLDLLQSLLHPGCCFHCASESAAGSIVDSRPCVPYFMEIKFTGNGWWITDLCH